MILCGKLPIQSNQERSAEKKDIVLTWVGACDFSTIELLSALFGQNKDGTNLFFRRLISDGFLVRFFSEHMNRKDLVRIGSAGVVYLEKKYGINVKRKMRSDEISRKRKLFHDYCLQIYIVERIKYRGNYSFLTEKNIFRNAGDAQRIMDALVFDFANDYRSWNVSQTDNVPQEVTNFRRSLWFPYDERGFWINHESPIAIEIELSAKSKEKTEFIFKRLFSQIFHGNLKQIRFVFDNQAVCSRYKKWFDYILLVEFKIPSTSPYSQCFVFEVFDFKLQWADAEEE